jgi:hypothetical protein
LSSYSDDIAQSMYHCFELTPLEGRDVRSSGLSDESAESSAR